MRYTPAQTRWFLEAVERTERAEHRQAIMAARVAQAAVRDLKAYLDDLKAGD